FCCHCSQCHFSLFLSLIRSACSLFIFSFCFFLLLLRPPSSTLFPYTTLFRSFGSPAESRSGWKRCPRVPASPGWTAGRRRSPAGDRKSTRLNSSHVSISYAVFCLKK